MQLITKAIDKAFKKQGYTGNKNPKDIKVICKFFNPCGVGTWYVYEKEDEDILCAFVNLGDPRFAECGIVLLSELQNTHFPPWGLTVERDRSFPIGKYSLQDVIDKIKNGGHI